MIYCCLVECASAIQTQETIFRKKTFFLFLISSSFFSPFYYGILKMACIALLLLLLNLIFIVKYLQQNSTKDGAYHKLFLTPTPARPIQRWICTNRMNSLLEFSINRAEVFQGFCNLLVNTNLFIF